MIMERLILALIMMVSAGWTLAQNPQFSKYGKVTAADFAPTGYEDLGYKAVITQSTRNMFFDELSGSLRLYAVYHLRLKVLEDGFSDPDFFTVRYSGRYEYERVLADKICVYQLNGTKIQKKKIKMKDLETYQRDSVDSWQKVNLPPLKRGDIIDWEYTIVSFDFMMPPIWKPQYKYPCVSAALITSFPDFMRYRYDLRGDDTLRISHSESYGYQTYNYLYSPKDNPKSISYMQGGRHAVQVIYRFNMLVDSFVVAHTMPDVAAHGLGGSLYGNCAVRMKASRFTQNIGYGGVHFTAWQQLTHLLYVYADPDNRYISQSEAWYQIYNPGYVIVESQNWPRFHKRLVKSPDFWKPVMRFCPIPPELENLRDLENGPDTMAVTRAVYNYVRQNYQWNREMQNHLPGGLDNVHKQKKGGSAEINMAMVRLMRQMGLDAFPVLAATRSFGDVDTTYANIQQFNNILACVRINGGAADGNIKYIILDAALPSDSPMSLPSEDRNGIAMAVDTDRFFFMEIDGHTSDTYNAKKL